MTDKTATEPKTSGWLKEMLWFIFSPAFHYKLKGIRAHVAGDLDKAIENYSWAIKFSWWDPKIYVSRAETFVKKGDYEKALKDVEKALAIKPDHFPARKWQLKVLYQLGRYQEVLDAPAFSKPFDQDILFNSPLLKRLPNAMGQRILQGYSNSKALLRLVRSQAFYQLGRIEEAEAELELAFKLDPDEVNLHMRRAGIRYAQGCYSEGKAAYERALEIDQKNDEKNPSLLNNFAWLLATCPSDEVRDGARALEMALRRSGNSREAVRSPD